MALQFMVVLRFYILRVFMPDKDQDLDPSSMLKNYIPTIAMFATKSANSFKVFAPATVRDAKLLIHAPVSGVCRNRKLSFFIHSQWGRAGKVVFCLLMRLFCPFSNITEAFPDIRKSFSVLRKWFPDIPERFPVLRKRFPDIPKRFPDIRKPFPDIPKRLPDIRKGSPDIPEALPDIRKSFSDIPKTFPALRKWFPDMPKTFPDIWKAFSHITKAFRDVENVSVREPWINLRLLQTS
jgi:hypothetical protein